MTGHGDTALGDSIAIPRASTGVLRRSSVVARSRAQQPAPAPLPRRPTSGGSFAARRS